MRTHKSLHLRRRQAAKLGAYLWAYLWASPNTLLALLLALPILALGGHIAPVQGVLEVTCPTGNGWLRRWFGRYEAVTLGHVVIADCDDTLCKHRAHEHVHVRQYERWGLLFLPAYAIASVVAWLQGRHFYWDNVFEVQARAGAVKRDALRSATTPRR